MTVRVTPFVGLMVENTNVGNAALLADIAQYPERPQT
jgi:hypothetical protein